MIIICKNKVSAERLATVPTPQGTDSFVPIAHSHLVNLTRQAIERAGFAISDEEHGLARDGMNYFGGFALKGEGITSIDKRLVLGLRNSNIKQFAASICIGGQMLVCENLHFSSDEKLARRHTTNILQDLPRVLADCIGRCVSKWETIDRRFEAYKEIEISKNRAADLLIDLTDSQALPAREIYNVMQQFRTPNHPEFKDQTLFSLFNAFTECMKGSDLNKLPFRSMVVESIFDKVARFESKNPVLPA